ncbi:MAG: hypothetical protein U0R49_11595 [Fimbriimonadales bacterium]
MNMLPSFLKLFGIHQRMNAEEQVVMGAAARFRCAHRSAPGIADGDQTSSREHINRAANRRALPTGFLFQLEVTHPVGFLPQPLTYAPAVGLPDYHHQNTPLGVLETRHDPVE